MRNNSNKIWSLLLASTLIGCSVNPPIIENMQRSGTENSPYYEAFGGRITSKAKYIEKYELNASEKYNDTNSLTEEYGVFVNTSRRFKYFAVGTGITNLTPYLHVSGYIPNIASISPYAVLNYKGSIKVLPGVIASVTPLKYFGFKSALYLEYNSTDTEPCGTFLGPCGLMTIGPFKIIDYGIFANLPIESESADKALSVNIGVKRQIETSLSSIYVQVSYQAFSQH